MVDLVRDRDDTFPVVRQVKSTETGAAIDITGWSIIVNVSTKPFPADTATLQFAISATLTTPLSGKYQWVPTIANANIVGRMFFRVRALKPDGSKETLEKGLYTVIEDIK